MTDDPQRTECPGCRSPRIETLESIRANELIDLYRKSAKMDVATYFVGVTTVHLQRCAACDLRFYDPPCAGDGAFYEQLQKFDWYYNEEKAEYEFARGFVSADCNVLDVGCGSGAFHSWLPPSVTYVGLEFNDEAIRKASSRGLHVVKQSVQDHAAQFPGKYDVVCAFQVLEHIPEPESFFRACIDALTPTGKLILTVPAEDSFLALATNLYLNMPPHHALRWSDLALRNIATREGLNVMQIWHEPVATYHDQMRANVLAKHFFTRWRGKPRLIETDLVDKLLGRLLRIHAIRDACASRAAAHVHNAQFGHTVGLVASR